ncbi:MAG: hypothetical protein ACR2M3_10940 [Thermomicrobiales bacterium]
MMAGWQGSDGQRLGWEHAAPSPMAGARQPSRAGMVRWVVIALALACYGVACAVPALAFDAVYHQSSRPEPSVYSGGGLLALGWLAVLYGQVAWFANPALACSLVLTAARRWRAAAALALVALLLAAALLLFNRQHIPANEGGTADLILLRPLLGCYLWLGSIVVAGLGALLGLATDRRLRLMAARRDR